MKYIITAVFLLQILAARAQSSYIPLNKDYYHLIDRAEIKSSKIPDILFSASKPFERKAVIQLLDSIENDNIELSKVDRFNLEYLRRDSWEWNDSSIHNSKKPILKYFYKKKADFYSVSTKDFDLHVNPVIYFSAGRESASPQKTFVNTRGIEVRGMINRKVGFYAFMADNQARFPQYAREYITNILDSTGISVPGEGYTKPFKTGGFDFLTARGYFTFNIIKNIQFQFGHDKNFIGNGYRSLILSDFSSNYTFLKLNTKVWKFNYENIFAEMFADEFNQNRLLPKKYLAFHHLSFNVSKNFNIGVFESVVFGRNDPSKHGQFDIGYLNPIIFYRSVEQQNGSQDNAILGMDYKWNFLKHFSFYGQIVLDEFLLSAVKERKGWWANKQAAQFGIKYIDVAGISNLDLQLETNIVRPYTYSHTNQFTNYAHYNQALAHPLGANFYEGIGIVRYQPLKRLSLTAKIIAAKYGSDTSYFKSKIAASDNKGGNILKSYNDVAIKSTFGNKIGQGISNTLIFLNFTATYQIKHNLFIDFNQTIRKVNSSLDSRDTNTSYTSLSLRWNIPYRLQEF